MCSTFVGQGHFREGAIGQDPEEEEFQDHAPMVENLLVLTQEEEKHHPSVEIGMRFYKGMYPKFQHVKFNFNSAEIFSENLLFRIVRYNKLLLRAWIGYIFQ